jgi:hypothetical protein
MNGNPTAEQRRYHDELREMYFYTQMHSPGEWFVIMLPKTVHDDIKNYSFDAERGMFLKQQRDYEKYFDKESPVPSVVIEFYKKMLSKHHCIKSWV